MGLDMYLHRMPRYKDCGVNDVCNIEEYLYWADKKKDPTSNAKKHTLKEWAGIDYRSIRRDAISFYRQHYKTQYSEWDEKKEYPFKSLKEEVGYWRKANQIHNWFVQNVQNMVDDCGVYEVSEEQLKELLDVCRKVLTACTMVPGKVHTGTRYMNGQTEELYEDGLVVLDKNTALELLPPARGFFFGSCAIDQYYVEDVADTIKIIENVLATTDFKTQIVAYHASW